ncbi:hypothetical protein EVAR_36954_1 [Eumeta japonica]|uniref:Secreted protein n=1 Tax=Eumeta variegata TaxID=151549 RepID=A0A4C1W7T0_EUMVA|nr:hypothetical protein EVAR_36954_1 [Eumeta japonica]
MFAIFFLPLFSLNGGINYTPTPTVVFDAFPHTVMKTTPNNSKSVTRGARGYQKFHVAVRANRSCYGRTTQCPAITKWPPHCPGPRHVNRRRRAPCAPAPTHAPSALAPNPANFDTNNTKWASAR